MSKPLFDACRSLAEGIVCQPDDAVVSVSVGDVRAVLTRIFELLQGGDWPVEAIGRQLIQRAAQEAMAPIVARAFAPRPLGQD
jgi:hypothetical protein